MAMFRLLFRLHILRTIPRAMVFRTEIFLPCLKTDVDFFGWLLGMVSIVLMVENLWFISPEIFVREAPIGLNACTRINWGICGCGPPINRFLGGVISWSNLSISDPVRVPLPPGFLLPMVVSFCCPREGIFCSFVLRKPDWRCKLLNMSWRSSGGTPQRLCRCLQRMRGDKFG